MVAIESTGTVNQEGQLVLNRPLSLRNQVVKVIILVPDVSDDTMWLKAAGTNQSFSFLHDEAEEVYTLTDGVPLTDEK